MGARERTMSVARATVRRVRVATWNVNSVKQRVPRLLPWLDQRQPDVVCLQETKLADAVFTELLGEELARRGYAVALHGEAQWNGVAILSKVGLDDVVAGVAGAPGRPRPATGSGCTRYTYRTGGCRTLTITTTSWPGWPRCGTWSLPLRKPRWSA